MEKLIGKITHYFPKIGVGVIEIAAGALSVGDTISIKGGDRDFTQEISSMQIDRQEVQTASAGQAIGLKVNQAVKEGDEVYKIA